MSAHHCAQPPSCPERTEAPASPRATARAERRRWLWLLVATVWFGSAAAGLWVLWSYENQPGVAAHALPQWPAGSGLAHDTDGPTLVMLVHPHCTCSRASLTELAEILARTTTRPKTYVLFLKPRDFADGWEKTDTWRAAAALPGATVVRDDEGARAERFGAVTSGQTFLYDAGGQLMFSGGITGSRGHTGDNAGRSSVLALLNQAPSGGSATAPRDATSVFGCSLFSAPGAPPPGAAARLASLARRSSGLLFSAPGAPPPGAAARLASLARRTSGLFEGNAARSSHK